jgi:hypothetical protein
MSTARTARDLARSSPGIDTKASRQTAVRHQKLLGKNDTYRSVWYAFRSILRSLVEIMCKFTMGVKL